MSATEVLCRLLDERGVEWTYGDGTVSFSDGKHWCHAWAYNDDTMCVSMGYFTPEQAIEATLGNEESYTRDDVESAFVSGYSLGCLPVGSDPQWDQNEQTVDEHMAELGWVRAELLPDMRARVVE